MIDQRAVAKQIRQRLEARLASVLGCKACDLPRMRIGVLANSLFLLEHGQVIGGYDATFEFLVSLLGRDLVWELPEEKAEEEEKPKPAVVVN